MKKSGLKSAEELTQGEASSAARHEKAEKRQKRKQKEKLWPLDLASEGKSRKKEKAPSPVFAGRINRISLKEPEPGIRHVSFTLRNSDGEDRTYELNRGEWADAADLLVAAYAGKRKVRITTAEAGEASRIVEIEARK